MNAHERINDLLPLYAAGTLADDDRRLVEDHLPGCPACQADLALWQEVGGSVIATDRAIQAPPGLLDQALQRAKPAQRRVRARSLRWMIDLLRVQMTLVRNEIWPASTAVIAMGCVVAWLSDVPQVITMLTPMVAAACLAAIYGPANDLGIELAVSTPTSPRQILLARVALVYGFNLVLAFIAGLVVYPLFPVQPIGALVLAWLGPMTFLSATALLLSLWIGPGNAVAVAYGGWLLNLFTSDLTKIPQPSPAMQALLEAFQSFWANPGLLLSLALVFILIAAWKAGKKDLRMPDWA